MTQATDRLLLDLAHAFARQVEFFADLFERHFRTADAEEIFNCGTTEEKRSLIHALIRKIILTGNDVVIEWAFI